MDITLGKVLPAGVSGLGGVNGLSGLSGLNGLNGLGGAAGITGTPGVTSASDFAAQLAEQIRGIPTTSTGLTGTKDAALRTEEPGLTPRAGAGAGNVMESFGKLLSQALQDVNTLHQSADSDAARLAAGDESVDIHQVMIGMEKANISLGLTLQVRNKLVEAYQEIMRMQV